MNRNDQFQKGFKTFILTLSLSLIVFSVVYYVITNTSSPNDYALNSDIESENEISEVIDEPAEAPETVFEELANQKMLVPERAVLAAEDARESTEATTPEGGVVSITVGLIASVAVFMFGMWVFANDPRRVALLSFENKIRNGL